MLVGDKLCLLHVNCCYPLKEKKEAQEKLNNLPKVTQLSSVKTGIYISGIVTLKPALYVLSHILMRGELKSEEITHGYLTANREGDILSIWFLVIKALPNSCDTGNKILPPQSTRPKVR
jgi:hypothetical protein